MTFREHPTVCPRCRVAIARTGARDRWHCAGCTGQLWTEAEVMAKLLAVAPDLATDGVPHLPTWSRGTSERLAPCPVCAAPMEPVFLGGVDVDRCRTDQLFWFDAAEIERVVDVAYEQHAKRDERWIVRALRSLFSSS